MEIKMAEKEKMRKNSIVVWIGILLFICAFIIFFASLERVYPEEVLNTMKACDWCESIGEELYHDKGENFNTCPQCVGGATAHACVQCYREHFNLTKSEYPCYIWRSDETPPSKLEWRWR